MSSFKDHVIFYGLSGIIGFGALNALKSYPLQVTTRVKDTCKSYVNYQVNEINITNEDVQRGFIDIKDAVIIDIHCNAKHDFILHFENIESISFEEIYIEGVPGYSVILLLGNDIFLYQRIDKSKSYHFPLEFKIIFKKDIKLGIHPFPVRINIQML